jgi:hypothetical protein
MRELTQKVVKIHLAGQDLMIKSTHAGYKTYLLLSLSYSQIDSDSDLMVVKSACLACEEHNWTQSCFF